MNSPVDVPMSGLRGARLLVLNWRDVRHSQAGGAERYMHEVSRRWVAAGIDVTWLTAREPGAPREERIDGVRVLRAGGTLSVYPRVAARVARHSRHYDAIIDCQNGIPFFSPLFAVPGTPIVQIVHHVHQEQFATRFSAPVAALGRLLEGTAARRVYGSRSMVAVSPSTRLGLRRLGFGGRIFVVPNGADTVQPRRDGAGRDEPVPGAAAPGEPVPDARSAAPSIVVVTRLVPHKRVDLLLHALTTVVAEMPDLRVDVVGGGPELPRLRALAARLGLAGVVRLHGHQPDEVRDALLRRAWLTTSTSAAEGWGITVIEAAGRGVPCAALDVPGIRDSVIDGRTGWLVTDEDDLPRAIIDALRELADPVRAAELSRACRAWAGCFDWDRTASMLAAVVRDAISAGHWLRHHRERRARRTDIAVLARFPADQLPRHVPPGRATDEFVVDGGEARALLLGRDELDARAALARLGVTRAEFTLATRYDLLVGPGGLPERVSADQHFPTTLAA